MLGQSSGNRHLRTPVPPGLHHGAEVSVLGRDRLSTSLRGSTSEPLSAPLPPPPSSPGLMTAYSGPGLETPLQPRLPVYISLDTTWLVLLEQHSSCFTAFCIKHIRAQTLLLLKWWFGSEAIYLLQPPVRL